MSARVVPILLYHAVADGCDPRFREWTVAPERFAEHMTHLAERGYRPLTLSQLADHLDRGDVPPRSVAITFDDGFADVHSAAWPELRRTGLSATVFVATGFVGATSGWLAAVGEDDRPMMTWAEIAELSAAGIECGAHGHRHLQLDLASPAAAEADITASKRALEEVVGPVGSFAYPHGYYTDRLRRQVADAGFRSACAVKHALSCAADDRFALARLIVRDTTGVDELERMLSGDGLAVAPRGGHLRRAGWRTVRRAGGEALVGRLR